MSAISPHLAHHPGWRVLGVKSRYQWTSLITPAGPGIRGAARQPAPNLEVETEEANGVCRGLMGPGPVTLNATSNTPGHGSVVCVSQVFTAVLARLLFSEELVFISKLLWGFL